MFLQTFIYLHTIKGRLQTLINFHKPPFMVNTFQNVTYCKKSHR